MSQMSIHSQPVGPKLGVPGSAPSLTPSTAPVSTPSHSLASDQNQVKVGSVRASEMGDLPWDAADVQNPQLRFTETAEFQSLSPEQQATVKEFFATSAPEGTAPEQAATIADQLATLLTHGKLSEKDAFGATVLDHLATFNQAPLHESLQGQTSKAEIAQDLLKALSDPASLTQGVDTLDCAEATLEATLAFSQPGDFARIATQLATKGSATIPGSPKTPGSEEMALVTLGNRAERNMLSHMMQGSFKAKVDGRPPLELKALDGAGKLEKTGLDSSQVKMLYDGITGKDHLTLYAADGVNLVPSLAKALENSESGVIKVTMKSDTGLHAVAVTGFSEEGVSIWDPATGEARIMSNTEFNSLLVRATVDREALDKGKHTERNFSTRNEIDKAVNKANEVENQVSQIERTFNSSFNRLTQGIKNFFGKLGELLGKEGGGRVGGSSSKR